MDLREEVTAAHGVSLAQTALFCSLIGVLKARGVLNQDLINVVLDAAVTQIEVTPSIDPDMAQRARQILEIISQELGGPARQDPS